MTFEEQKQQIINEFSEMILPNLQYPFAPEKQAKQFCNFIINSLNNLRISSINISLYKENIVKGDVLWIGSNGLSSKDDCLKTETEIVPKLDNEDYAYVLMKVKVRNEI
jgi:hypothetical protein